MRWRSAFAAGLLARCLVAGLVLSAVACGLAGCRTPAGFAGEPTPYLPDRRDYAAFRAGYADLLEPNYLPFMVHRVTLSDASEDPAGDVLVFCRWDRAEMPLPVFVSTPNVPEALQDEFRPRDPADYTEAVAEALRMWEGELEGYVTFTRVERPEDALLRFELIGGVGPSPGGDVQVLGTTSFDSACRVSGWDESADRLEVSFSVPEVRIYVADQHGLLHRDQVAWVALHEIGHALGMRLHSPIPADLMFEEVRDRVRVGSLSDQDVNSFVSLYRLPNGAVFGRLPPGGPGEPARPLPPTGEPLLELAPYVDAVRGYELRLPSGWLRIDTRMGVIAVDGVTWDYTASFQVIVQRYPTIEAYLERYGRAYLMHGRLLDYSPLRVSGKRAMRGIIAVPNGELVEEITFIETGDGRVLIVIADCPPVAYEAYRPWFDAALATLAIWDP